MKRLKWLSCGILLAGMYLTSCKKGADPQAQPDAPAANKEQLFEKSLTVYNAEKTNNTTLRFRAASQELLNKTLANTEFTLEETPASATKAIQEAPASGSGEEGSASYFDASGKVTSLPRSTSEKRVLSKGAIQVDIPDEPQSKSVSIQVKSKDQSSAEQAAAEFTEFTTEYSTTIHKIVVNNSPNSRTIYVTYSYYRYGWIPEYYLEQPRGTVSTYRKCSYPAGVSILAYSGSHFTITRYSSC